MYTSSSSTVKYVSESFIKPNLENVRKSNQPYILSPWDLLLLSIHYTQWGLVFTKPQTQTFTLSKLVETLKQSLALTLVHFYPLAGQLTTHIDQDRRKCVVFVDYNKGPGAHFVHATTLDFTLSDILSPTYIPRIVYSLFGQEGTLVNFDGRSRPLLSVQVTGLLDGIFIGFSVNHCISDGISIEHFLRLWAEIHNSKTKPPSPILPPPIIGDRSLEYAYTYNTHPNEVVNRYEAPSEMKSRIFHFSSESMRRLKSKVNKDVNVSNGNIKISYFQALSALIWRAVVRAIGLPKHEMTNCSVAINARKRFEPPLPQEYFGNVLDVVVATTKVDELVGQNIGWVASLLREFILNYDSKSAIEFTNRWLEAPSFVDFNKTAALRWVRIGGSPTFDGYSHNFGGLGVPVATRFGIGNKFPGKVNVTRAYEGGASADVEISLMPESMANLESDQEFMNLVSLPNCELHRSKI